MHFGGGISKKGGRQNVQKWMGKQKGGGGEEGGGGVGEPRSFEKIGGGNLPRRTLWSWRSLLRIH